MEQFNYTFGRTRRPDFDATPAASRYRLWDVDYVRVTGKQGGELFLTRHGWGCVESVLPSAWFVGDRFKKVGRPAAGATGAVYRVPVVHRARAEFTLLVKFSRAAQDTAVTVLDRGAHLDDVERAKIEAAAFLGPFEEFANLQALRRAAGGAILTEQPLAIYSPPTRYHDWQLGRHASMCHQMSRGLEAEQADVPEERRIRYDWERIYILLYRWVEGIDAEAAAQAGMISTETMQALGLEARATLARFGWMVCDHKPRHVVIRRNRRGDGLLGRAGAPRWALIDYELLVRR